MVVVGDVNSTLAAALVAAKLLIPLAHVEAGLRSFDRTMPEEINRIVTDSLSDLLFATEAAGIDNLARENVKADCVSLVGNVMIDSLYDCLDRAVPIRTTFAEIGVSDAFIGSVASSGFGFVTLHRPSNVDAPANLKLLIEALIDVSRRLPLVFPVHPRTKAMIANAGLDQLIPASSIATAPPLSYLRAVGLMREARLVITDSGGVQEETTALGVPCLTVRENTERPATIEEGTNTLVGTDPRALIAAVDDVLLNGGKRGRIPQLWDGHAAIRIVDGIEAFLDTQRRPGGR